MTMQPLVVLAMLLVGSQINGNAFAAGEEVTIARSTPNKQNAHVKQKAKRPAISSSDPCADKRNRDFDPDKCVDPDVRIDPFVGKWKITGVYVKPDGVQAFVQNDKTIVGSIFTVAVTEIKWATLASTDFTSDDVCKQPSAGQVPPIVERAQGSALTAALKFFAVSPKLRGQLHRFGCASGGTWGPGEASAATLFIPVGGRAMVLKWYDGVILLAKRDE